ncbi:alpha/beta-hydrolase [Neolentinus lepideus HHB14362 ss-1]|uniref:Alpha/beta-hydrolase n=1 Tax=Neolentinus lepideus HHB14362 ss-1 TaxID=1314782 RepID=A0A165THV4_9AGAM|nr:alpha/beta-hydrolase [Neolentinus lepideus HHB14362 ss-1]
MDTLHNVRPTRFVSFYQFIMLDHLLGRPSPSWKRAKVFLVLCFWLWQIMRGHESGPRLLWIRRANRRLQRFTPWQIIVSTLTAVYALRNIDKILGLMAPEPLANLYSPSYYRATWIATGLDAGFATAMSIRPKWLKDICSLLFSAYYIIYANEAEEKLRRFRAVPTVEMLRTTWEKTTNPYIRAITYKPRVSVKRKILLPRPRDSDYQRPITAWLLFAPPENKLSQATDLIFDVPGGGFIAMTPEHHDERLHMWAVRTGKPVLSIDYGKAPEYPYPFAIDEIFDTYRVLVESSGQLIGMSGKKLNIIMTGDSAGACFAANCMIKIVETQSSLHLPSPTAMVLNYAALDFNFTSWMSPANLQVLRSEQSSGHISGLAEQKDHFGHISPLSMVGDRRLRRRRHTWRDALKELNFASPTSPATETPPLRRRARPKSELIARPHANQYLAVDAGSVADEEDEGDSSEVNEEDRPIYARARHAKQPSLNAVQLEEQQQELSRQVARADSDVLKKENKAPIGTRITMTSRTGYFQDRIISPSMMRAMAILYIGPYRNPDFATDYHISPILAPSHILAQFPPLLMQCGEKDPFVDDTVIFAGRVREAKRERRRELERAVSGASAKFGESLRMSAAEGGRSDAALRRELDRLAAESEDDWVQMVIYSEWSHGYLQMPMLMSEARAAINDVADWMDDVFSARGEGVAADRLAGASNSLRVPSTAAPVSRDVGASTSETETDDPITFVTKKRSPRSSVTEGSDKSHVSRASSDDTLHEEPVEQLPKVVVADEVDQRPTASTEQPENAARARPTPRLDILHGSILEMPEEVPERVRSPRRGSASKGTWTATITETELMRRRRMLDSHIFE